VEDYPFSVTFAILVTKLWELEKGHLSNECEEPQRHKEHKDRSLLYK